MKKERFLNQLISLIDALSKSELELARKHLRAYRTNYTHNRNKMFQLYDLLGYKNLQNYDSIVKKVSPAISEESFNRLIKRTMNKIQESLIIDVSINRKNAYSDIFKVRFEVRKQIMRSQILMSKGLVSIAKNLLPTIIKKTKVYELYDELIEALFHMQTITSNSSTKKEFEEIKEQIAFYENCRGMLLEAKGVHQNYKISMNEKLKQNQLILYLDENITKLHEYAIQTNSANIFSYYYLLLMERNYWNNLIQEEIDTGFRFLELIKSSKAIYSRPRIAFLYASMSNTALSACQFEMNYEYSEKSIYWSKSNPNINHIIARQQQIKSLIFLGKHEDCHEKIEKFEKNELLNKYPFYKTHLRYLNAINYFALGEFRLASKLLYDLREIEKDKEGWNIWIKITRIIIDIELGDISMIDYNLESTRKYFSRLKMASLSQRHQTILGVLMDLEKNNFNFKLVYKKKVNNILKLKSLESEYQWDPKSPEMILFHDWFEAKLEKRSYKPNFNVYLKDLVVRKEKKSVKVPLENLDFA